MYRVDAGELEHNEMEKSLENLSASTKQSYVSSPRVTYTFSVEAERSVESEMFFVWIPVTSDIFDWL